MGAVNGLDLDGLASRLVGLRTCQRPAPRSARVLVVGNAPVDLVLDVGDVPRAGAEVAAAAAIVSAGGAFNVSLACARAGAEVAFAGGHGTGLFGDVVRAAFADAGVPMVQSRSPERDSGWLVAFVDGRGARSFVTPPGTVMPLTSRALDRLTTLPGDVVYVSGYVVAGSPDPGPLLGWLTALPSDRTLYCDLGPSGSVLEPDALLRLLGRVDWLACNADEAAEATGETDPSLAAQALLARAPRASVLVHDGANGCVLLARESGGPLLLPAPEVTVVDTNGAGDAHSGWFVAGLAAGLSPVAAARRATVAAALSVTRPGPAMSPTAAEVEAVDAGLAGDLAGDLPAGRARTTGYCET